MLAANERKTFHSCQCFLTKNYYLADYGVHVEYHNNEEKLRAEFGEELALRGCSNKENIVAVLKHLDVEYKRRKCMVPDSQKRIEEIQLSYIPLHKEVYCLKEEYLDDEFLKLVKVAKYGDYTTLVELMKKENSEKVFRLPVFKIDFCRMLTEELDHFEKSSSPKGRPNTMNNQGILLDELGFNDAFLSPLREIYLNPLCLILFPEWGGGRLDSHKAFTVQYEADRDIDLGFHFDNAEVTLNVSLGKDFDDGSLYFGQMRQESVGSEKATEVRHVIGEGILHRGQHMHGALPISYGQRINLIIWMRASVIRNQLCPMCDLRPRLRPMPGFGDGFTTDANNEPTTEVCVLS